MVVMIVLVLPQNQKQKPSDDLRGNGRDAAPCPVVAFGQRRMRRPASCRVKRRQERHLWFMAITVTEMASGLCTSQIIDRFRHGIGFSPIFQRRSSGSLFLRSRVWN